MIVFTFSGHGYPGGICPFDMSAFSIGLAFILYSKPLKSLPNVMCLWIGVNDKSYMMPIALQWYRFSAMAQ